MFGCQRQRLVFLRAATFAEKMFFLIIWFNCNLRIQNPLCLKIEQKNSYKNEPEPIRNGSLRKEFMANNKWLWPNSQNSGHNFPIIMTKSNGLTQEFLFVDNLFALFFLDIICCFILQVAFEPSFTTKIGKSISPFLTTRQFGDSSNKLEK